MVMAAFYRPRDCLLQTCFAHHFDEDRPSAFYVFMSLLPVNHGVVDAASGPSSLARLAKWRLAGHHSLL
jgi:hypothetical protein